ncbi:MarR family winged helix-turn-helix transcriptional regulator [Paenibacillus sp. sgz500958]|uniref:MarR family winged helix-turn-helix transcriptional regulator n=1 Tax=Paenibacillus sp. sgz500958 TaxID=3242475 RepID=UPI0036D213CA
MDNLQQYLLEQPLTARAFFGLVEATAELVGVSEKYWQAKGLNGARIRILVEIAKAGGRMLPSELARTIGVTKANITLLLTPLEKDGFISRNADGEDGRKSVISITGHGRQLLIDHIPGNRQVIAEHMGGLSEADMEQLISLLQKLIKPAR